MPVKKRKTKIKDMAENLADSLNQVSSQSESSHSIITRSDDQINLAVSDDSTKLQSETMQPSEVSEVDESNEKRKLSNSEVFDLWEETEIKPQDFVIDVPVDSLEAKVGYSSLFRQMHQAFVRNVAFHRSAAGGSLTIEEARKQAFHACTNREEAKKVFDTMMSLPLESLSFVDLMELHSFSPRVAEMFWELAKIEGREEFESGHLSANITFPVGYMKQVWNIARYLGVRQSFLEEWKPRAGVEVAMIDMLTQSYFQWQYWLEQTVKRSETRERETHPDYSRWLAQREREFKANGWTDGYWNRPYVSEQQAIEHAVQMADRFNRIFMRTLRQLRDLRRYSPVTINNASQVNIAADGGQQVNITKNN